MNRCQSKLDSRLHNTSGEFIFFYVFSIVVDPNTLNLDLDPDPGFWPNLDPDPGPDPDPGLYYKILK